MINRTNEAYERQGRACITRKSIPGKYIVDKAERGKRPHLTPPGPAAAPDRLPVGSMARIVSQARSADWRRFVPESKGEPDYGGVLAPDGRGIFYDAKTTRRESLDFDNLHPHQVEFLERTSGCGAVAGFLVEFSLHQTVYFLPIQVLLRWRAESRRKSLPYSLFFDFLTPAPSGKGMVIFDYLLAIESQEATYGRDFSRFRIG
ncbi:MAG: Holliday junction resolvase RecU [Acidobacteriota bacterium]